MQVKEINHRGIEMTAKQLTILQLLNELTDEERTDIFYEYCRYCGSKNPRCQCMNDE
jgi:hypothetical protein